MNDLKFKQIVTSTKDGWIQEDAWNPIRSSVVGLVFMIVLLISFQYSFLLFHMLSELFSILIAWSIFTFAWNSRRFVENDYLLFLGIAYLCVGFLDLMHALAYKEMNIFAGYDADLPTQLWIAARGVQSLSLLIAPFYLRHKIKPWRTLLIFALIAVFLSVLIFSGIFPSCYKEGSGLTNFKKISEYVISIILLSSAYFLYRRKDDFNKSVFHLLLFSIFLTILSELAFTFYLSVFGIVNFTGHLLKIFAFYLIYLAIIQTGLINPFNLLFRDLQKTSADLEKLATHDNLTQLPNRILFEYHLGIAVSKARREHNKVAVLFLDLDNFKNINDTYGHVIGDQVLVNAAEYFREQLRESDSIYRLAGDEFVILLDDLLIDQDVLDVINRLFSNKHSFEMTDGSLIGLSFSVGISKYPDDSTDPTTLLQHADQAMYRAKDKGKNSYQFFSDKD